MKISGNLEYCRRLDKSELFIDLAGRLFVEIHVFRESQSLDHVHLDIINMSILNLLNPSGDHSVFVHSIKNPVQTFDAVFENWMIMLGSDIFMRLSEEQRIKLNQGTIRPDRVDLSALILIFSEVFCDSDKCLQYFEILASRNAELVTSYSQQIKAPLNDMHRTMALSIVHFEDIQKALSRLKKQKKCEIFRCLALHPRDYIGNLPVLSYFLVDELNLSRSFHSISSEIFDDRGIRACFADFYNVFKSLKEIKEFDINLLRSVKIVRSLDETLVIDMSKCNFYWLNSMIDSLIFDFQVDALEDWITRIRLLKSLLDNLGSEFDSNYRTYNPSKVDVHASNLDILMDFSIDCSQISNAFVDGDARIYQSTNNLYYILDDAFMVCKKVSDSGFIILSKLVCADDFEPVFEGSSYVSVLKSLSRLTAVKACNNYPALQEVSQDMLSTLIAIRLDAFVINAMFYMKNRSCQLSFFQQAVTSLSTSELLNSNRNDRMSFFSKYVKTLELNVMSGAESEDLISCFSNENLCYNDYRTVPLSAQFLFLSMLGSKKNEYTSFFNQYCNSLDQSEVLDLFELVNNEQEFRSQLSSEHRSFEELRFAKQLSEFYELKTFKEFAGYIPVLKAMNSQLVYYYFSNLDNVNQLYRHSLEIISSYREFVENSSKAEYSTLKSSSYIYLRNLIMEINSAQKLDARMCSAALREINDIYGIAVARFDLQYKHGNRSNMLIFQGSSQISSALDKQARMVELLNGTLTAYVWKKSEGDPQYLELFAHLISSLNQTQINDLIVKFDEKRLLRKFYIKLISAGIPPDESLNRTILACFIRNLEKVTPMSVRVRSLKHMMNSAAIDLFFSQEIPLFDKQLQAPINSLLDDFEYSDTHLYVIIEEIIKNHFKFPSSELAPQDIFSHFLDR